MIVIMLAAHPLYPLAQRGGEDSLTIANTYWLCFYMDNLQKPAAEYQSLLKLLEENTVGYSHEAGGIGLLLLKEDCFPWLQHHTSV